MRGFITALIIVVGYILQSTLFTYIEIANIKPNLLLLIIIYFALIRGSKEGAIVGLSVGILLDILTGKILGAYSLLGMYIGLICGMFTKSFFKDNLIVVLIFAFSFSFMYEFIFYFFKYFLLGETEIVYALSKIIIPEAIYNTFLSIPVYKSLMKVNGWLEQKQK